MLSGAGASKDDHVQAGRYIIKGTKAGGGWGGVVFGPPLSTGCTGCSGARLRRGIGGQNGERSEDQECLLSHGEVSCRGVEDGGNVAKYSVATVSKSSRKVQEIVMTGDTARS